MAPSTTRVVMRPTANASLCRLTTGNRATAVPMPASATVSSSSVPTSTSLSLPEPRIQVGSLLSVPYRARVGIETNVMR